MALTCHQNTVMRVNPNTKHIAARSRNTLGLFEPWQSLQYNSVTCCCCCAIPRKTKHRMMKTNPMKIKQLLRINFLRSDLGCSCSSMAEFHLNLAPKIQSIYCSLGQDNDHQLTTLVDITPDKAKFEATKACSLTR